MDKLTGLPWRPIPRSRPKPVDIRGVRRRMRMTQRTFSMRFGFPVATLRHWEHGDRRPRGASLVLLNVIANNPGAVLRALHAPALKFVRRPTYRWLRE